MSSLLSADGRKRQRTRSVGSKRTFPIPRRMPKVATGTFLVKKTAVFSDITQPLLGTNVSNGAYSWTLAQFPEYASYVAVYDMYRIVKIKMTFVPCNEGAKQVSVTAPAFIPEAPPMLTCIDYNDNNPLTTEYDILTYDNAQIHPWGKPFSRVIFPAVSAQYYISGGSTGYGAKKKQWIDTASTSVQHYGLKYFIRDTFQNFTYNGYWIPYCTFYVEFRAAR